MVRASLIVFGLCLLATPALAVDCPPGYRCVSALTQMIEEQNRAQAAEAAQQQALARERERAYQEQLMAEERAREQQREMDHIQYEFSYPRSPYGMR